MGIMAYVAPLVGIIALGMAYSLAAWISKVEVGTDRMKEISAAFCALVLTPSPVSCSYWELCSPYWLVTSV